MDIITLYNQHREKVGETYPRRAKQLVRNGRAAWIEEKVSLQLTATDQSPALKEESIVVDRNDLTTNDSNRVEKHQLEFIEDDNLLKYLAQKNVLDRRNLIKHIVAFFVALLIFYIFVESSTYWIRVEADNAIRQLSRVWETQQDVYELELSNAI